MSAHQLHLDNWLAEALMAEVITLHQAWQMQDVWMMEPQGGR